MELPSIAPERDPEQLFGDILQYVEQAESIVTARTPLSLAGLDKVVDALCLRILGLGPEQAAEYAPELEHLVERLNSLQAQMTSMQGEIATTIKSLNTRSKAARAYVKAKPED